LDSLNLPGARGSSSFRGSNLVNRSSLFRRLPVGVFASSGAGEDCIILNFFNFVDLGWTILFVDRKSIQKVSIAIA
jgi:hypothetical protein